MVKTARFPPLCGGGDPPLDDSDMDVSQTTYQVQCCPMWGKLAEGKLPFGPWLVLARTPKGPYYGVARYCMNKTREIQKKTVKHTCAVASGAVNCIDCVRVNEVEGLGGILVSIALK